MLRTDYFSSLFNVYWEIFEHFLKIDQRSNVNAHSNLKAIDEKNDFMLFLVCLFVCFSATAIAINFMMINLKLSLRMCSFGWKMDNLVTKSIVMCLNPSRSFSALRNSSKCYPSPINLDIKCFPFLFHSEYSNSLCKTVWKVLMELFLTFLHLRNRHLVPDSWKVIQ